MKYLVLTMMGLFSACSVQAAMTINASLAKEESSPPDGPHKGLPPVNPNVAKADDACASYAGILLAHAEADDPRQVAEWRQLCSAHPLQATCASTVRFVTQNLGDSRGLICGIHKADAGPGSMLASQ